MVRWLIFQLRGQAEWLLLHAFRNAFDKLDGHCIDTMTLVGVTVLLAQEDVPEMTYASVLYVNQLIFLWGPGSRMMVCNYKQTSLCRRTTTVPARDLDTLDSVRLVDGHADTVLVALVERWPATATVELRGRRVQWL